jgi:hypothetical protein
MFFLMFKLVKTKIRFCRFWSPCRIHLYIHNTVFRILDINGTDPYADPRIRTPENESNILLFFKCFNI